jgi:homocysteine S-methyltransferase
MTKVTDRYTSTDGPVILCDFSPPRGVDFDALKPAATLDADFLCVAYNPGKAVRLDSAAAAAIIKRDHGRDAIFNLGTRDMNRLALQTHLLGAHALGLENVVVVQGDALTERERGRFTEVSDFTATGLIEAVGGMNAGKDYRGLDLTGPTDFCTGAAADLGRPLAEEAALTARKVAAGAHFLITQPIFDLGVRERFLDLYAQAAGAALDLPVFWGLQVLAKDGVVFSNVPESLRADLEKGRDGAEIALELYEAFRSAGIRGIYLVPPIYRGGARDYAAAARVIEYIRQAS